ncbi:hypothetical protein M885DRAFT_576417 [Pelagophyceae sp. CCMP2097]|nr:hypothetical protein M885DRAFT_576417 [Pelagophyceae sp. CCMP2097]
MCERLAAYAVGHGNCLVPQSFVTGDGHKLGSWVQSQRQKYAFYGEREAHSQHAVHKPD